jgi:peptidoglycan/xylan/chitin deacetylase (PgdA/CDA1 family)
MLNHNKIALFFVAIFMLLAVLLFFNTMEFWFFGIVGLLWFLTSLIGSSLIQSNYHVKAYCSNPVETQNKIAITFDDGPNEMTVPILEVLKKYNAKATFFCIGQNIEKHPEILKQIVSEGHLIGNHSYSHSHFFDFYRKQQVLQEINDTNALIEKIIGKKVRFFRPPYGVTNPSIRRALAVTKHKVIGWNIRSLDAVIRNEKTILDRITKRIKPGGIVLLHDTSMHTVNVLEQLLVVLRAKKYEVIAIEQLLNLKAYED